MADRLQDLFDQAVMLPVEQRGAFLDGACGGDSALRADLESLLACDDGDDGAAGPLDSPVVRTTGVDSPEFATTPLPLSAARPFTTRLGRYRVLRQVAEGGMGAVYEAEQDNPRRIVALKVIRPDRTSPTHLKRFAHESQILARLHHPGIAHVYESGVGDDGQPFFAMEFIQGLPLTHFADVRNLGLAERIALIARVCDAVQHAHDQGVVHRDLKPANILVEDSGHPKVLDFGVARAINADLLGDPDLTRLGQFLGTPNYMSPEQVSSLPGAIDRRSDVYALGVILYEMAARQPPYRCEDRPLAEAARLIVEQEPPRLGLITPALRGDVETIAAKALAKEPARRYQSAADLAADLRRWMAGEPIAARPATALYYLGKFARRNKGLVAALGATALALVLGMAGTLGFALREALQRDRAERSAREAVAEKREALFQAYRARLSAASVAISANNVADAARHLDAAPASLRDWEWKHLHARLDDSSSVVSLRPGEAGLLIPGPDRLRIGISRPDGLELTDLDGAAASTVPFRQAPHTVVNAWETREGLRVVEKVVDGFRLRDDAGREIGGILIPGGTQPRFALSPDGVHLAWPKNEPDAARLRLGDLIERRPTVVCDGHRENVWSFAFSPDGARIVSGGEDGAARLWDPATGRLVASFLGHTSKVLGVSFSADGRRLLTTSADGTVRQWDVASAREVEPPYDRHSGEVGAAVYSPDGKRVASAGSDRTVRVWDAQGRRDVAVLLGHTGNVTDLSFAPDGRRLASLSHASMLNIAGDDTLRGWDVDPDATLPVLRGHTSYVYPVAFRPDGRRIASGSWDETVRIWDAATGAPRAVLRHPGVVHGLDFAPDGRLAVACLADGLLRLWDVDAASVGREIELTPTGSLRNVAVRPDGRRAAATASEPDGASALVVCDLESGAIVFTAPGAALAYSPDARLLAVRGEDPTVATVLDAETHAPVANLRGHAGAILSAAFSPDGRLATCGQDRTVRVWRLDGGPCQVLLGHNDEVFAAAFHPDGRRLATGGRDRAVWIWDLSRGEEVVQLQGHSSFIWSLAFSPDGASLASGSGDFTVRLWDSTPLRTRHQARRPTPVKPSP